MAITISNVACFSVPVSTSYYTENVPTDVDVRTYMSTLGTNFYDENQPFNITYTVFENDIFRLDAQTRANHMRWVNLVDKQNNVNYDFFSNTNYKDTYLSVGYDDELRIAYLFSVGKYYYNSTWSETHHKVLGSSAEEQERIYQIFSQSQIPTFAWSSVPAISGKNGILLPMSTLNDINDGNEVTTSDTSKFNLNDSSNIKNLVDAVVNDF